MKRVWGHVLTGATVLAGLGTAGAVVSACVHDDSTLFVSRVLALQLVTMGMQCIYTADPTQPSITSGVLDAEQRSIYDAEFLVGNQLVPRGDPNQPSTETSIIKVEGAVVRIVNSSGTQITTYTKPVGITIPASSGTTPGYSPIQLQILDAATVQSLDVPNDGSGVDVVAYSRFFGHTSGGQYVESDDFGFPITVCRGCLVTVVDSCSASTSSTSQPCIIGQDFNATIDVCAADAGGGG